MSIKTPTFEADQLREVTTRARTCGLFHFEAARRKVSWCGATWLAALAAPTPREQLNLGANGVTDTQADPIGLRGGMNLFREIGGFWGTMFGWAIDHQFITWPTGSLGFQPNGGQAEVTFTNGVVNPIPGHVSHDTPNPEYDTKHETYFRETRPSQCPNCKAVWQCLDNFSKQFSTKNQWCVLGDNCHTAVSDALSACGLSRTPPAPPSPRFPHNKHGDAF